MNRYNFRRFSVFSARAKTGQKYCLFFSPHFPTWLQKLVGLRRVKIEALRIALSSCSVLLRLSSQNAALNLQKFPRLRSLGFCSYRQLRRKSSKAAQDDDKKPMQWSASVLTSVSSDTEPTIVLTFEKGKYIFNASENTNRAFLQSRRSWKRTQGVFFTQIGVQRASGLSGAFVCALSRELALTLSRTVDELCGCNIFSTSFGWPARSEPLFGLDENVYLPVCHCFG